MWQRAARWVSQHGPTLALHSMRDSARAAGFSAASTASEPPEAMYAWLVPAGARLTRSSASASAGSVVKKLVWAWATGMDEFALDPSRATLAIGATGLDGDTFENKQLMDKYGIQINFKLL